MKTIHGHELSPDNTEDAERIHQSIGDWWNQLRILGESGAASWEDLELLEREVTDCLTRDPPDVAKAISLTHRAMLLVAGCINL